MGKVVKMSDAERKRNSDYNEGYDTAYSDEEIDLDRYESNDDYRRGYDAGEADRDDEDTSGDFDPLNEDERVEVYGPDRDEL